MGLILDEKSWRLYESWSRSAEGRDEERVVEACVRSILNPQPGERVLDIGCGNGNHLLLFSRMGLDTTGIDASPHMISRARERLGSRTDLRVGNAEDLPFEDNEFDTAALIHTLEFLDDPLEALREAGRVARQRVFIGVMNSLSWHCLRAKTKGFFRESLFSHMRFYDLWELKSLVRAAFGDAPTVWACARMRAGLVERIGNSLNPWGEVKHWPFGVFLGLSVSLHHTLRTEQHPLTIGLREAQQPIIKGVTTSFGSESLPFFSPGGPSDERSLSL